jgi:hypothetical protein
MDAGPFDIGPIPRIPPADPQLKIESLDPGFVHLRHHQSRHEHRIMGFRGKERRRLREFETLDLPSFRRRPRVPHRAEEWRREEEQGVQIRRCGSFHFLSVPNDGARSCGEPLLKTCEEGARSTRDRNRLSRPDSRAMHPLASRHDVRGDRLPSTGPLVLESNLAERAKVRDCFPKELRREVLGLEKCDLWTSESTKKADCFGGVGVRAGYERVVSRPEPIAFVEVEGLEICSPDPPSLGSYPRRGSFQQD